MEDIAWERFHFMVFDTPDPSVRKEPYYVRYATLQQNLPDCTL